MGDTVPLCVSAFSEGQTLLCWVVFRLADFKVEEIAFRVDIIDFKRLNLGGRKG